MTSSPLPPSSSTSTSNPLSSGSNAPSGSEKTAQNVDQNAAQDAGLSALVVYTMSNDSTRNLIEGFAARNGSLQRIAPADTRGRGDPSIAGAAQGSLAVGDDGQSLFAVNAGSNEITSFRIGANGAVSFADKVTSNGKQPVSLTVHHDLLYVVNAGSSQITGFKIAANGGLHPIPNSTQPLSGNQVGPAEISFDPNGNVLVVTEKETNKIDTYSVTNDVPSAPMAHQSAGTEPFGFAFAPHSQIMVVSDGFNGAPGDGAASSYDVTPDRAKLISSIVPDQNTAPRWLVIAQDGRVAFTSNTGSDTISAYRVDPQGHLALTTGNGISAATGKGPTDLALAPDGGFLFNINQKAHTLGVYKVSPDGGLGRLKDAPQLPNAALGLAVLPMGAAPEQ